ncbi:gamma-thionin [Artemisia annua]|uniref:Gamma-thionin n=1 Tax=Artemisia annua TaxID=35608 RepID=A0A2U1LMJ8_ARTAN|nr:gamma-thionin [Artemisia annua]
MTQYIIDTLSYVLVFGMLQELRSCVYAKKYVLVYMVKGTKEPNKVCSRRSETWSGICGDSKHCDEQCRNWEGAAHGACHRQGVGRACFCYFNC